LSSTITNDAPGIVRSFKYKNDQWVKYGDDIQEDPESEWQWGAVSLSGNGGRLVVGPDVSTYKKKMDKWEQIGAELAGGSSLSLSNDGNTLLVQERFGAWNNGRTDSRVFFRNINNGWTQIGADLQGEWGDISTGTVIGEGMISGNGRVIGIVQDFLYPNESKGHAKVYSFPNQCVPPGSNCFKPDSKSKCDDSDCQSKVCNAISSCCTNWSQTCANKASELCRPCACKERKNRRFFIENPDKVQMQKCKWLKKRTLAEKTKICSTYSGHKNKKAARFVCPKSCRLNYCKS